MIGKKLSAWGLRIGLCILPCAALSDMTFSQKEQITVTAQPADDADWDAGCPDMLDSYRLPFAINLAEVGKTYLEQGLFERPDTILENRAMERSTGSTGFGAATPLPAGTVPSSKVYAAVPLTLSGEIRACGRFNQLIVVETVSQIEGDVGVWRMSAADTRTPRLRESIYDRGPTFRSTIAGQVVSHKERFLPIESSPYNLPPSGNFIGILRTDFIFERPMLRHDDTTMPFEDGVLIGLYFRVELE